MSRKLIIQIPCLNEADTLATTLSDLPRRVDGFAKVEWLVIDDGSTDETVSVAKRNGVDHVVSHTRNRGLAAAFMTGIEASLSNGADVIVNTDADNQYCADDIPLLTRSVVEGQADMVIGARPVQEIEHFSPLKKLLQAIGSWVVRYASKTDVRDAPSGFRAISRPMAERLMLFSEYTYTLESIIQAGVKDMEVVSVPVRVNPDLRPSRLVKSIPSYVFRSMLTILRIAVIYKPARFFSILALSIFLVGLLISFRFLYFFFTGDGEGHIQSLILAGALLTIGFQTFLVAFLSDTIAANRKLLEDIRYMIRSRGTAFPARDNAWNERQHHG